MEIKILDMIQNLHTTVGDHFFIGITKLGMWELYGFV